MFLEFWANYFIVKPMAVFIFGFRKVSFGLPPVKQLLKPLIVFAFIPNTSAMTSTLVPLS
jgi:hypothetical protein